MFRFIAHLMFKNNFDIYTALANRGLSRLLVNVKLHNL